MNASRALFLVTVSALPWALALADSPALGRLFLTPERRAALDRQRTLNIQEVQQAGDPAISLNGVVKRSSGNDTVWINGSPQWSKNRNIEWAGMSAARPEQIRISPPGDLPRQISVGDTLYPGSGEILSPLNGGRITVEKTRPSQ